MSSLMYKWITDKWNNDKYNDKNELIKIAMKNNQEVNLPAQVEGQSISV